MIVVGYIEEDGDRTWIYECGCSESSGAGAYGSLLHGLTAGLLTVDFVDVITDYNDKCNCRCSCNIY